MSSPVTNLPSILPLGTSNDSPNSLPNLRIVSPSITSVNPQPQNQASSNANPVLSQQPAATIQTPSNTTITSSSDRHHPHLDEDLQEPVQSMLVRHKSQAELTDQAINALKNARIINDKGEILALGHKVSGKMFKAEDGSFDFHITGPCSDNSVKELQNLKDKCIAAFVEAGIPQEAEQLVKGIIPEAAGPLTSSDLEILNNGGCIQYCATDKGYVKMALNPKDEGTLTLTCFSRSSEGISEGASQTIPAGVIFEGKEANGYKVEPPTLPNWKQRLEAIRTEDQQKSQLAQNDIWNAVTQYLKHNINGSDFNITGTRISDQIPDSNETLNDSTITQQNVTSTFHVSDSDNTSSIHNDNSHEPITDESSHSSGVQNDPENAGNNQNSPTESLQTTSGMQNSTIEDGVGTTNSAPTENSQSTSATNSDIQNFTLEQVMGKINTLFKDLNITNVNSGTLLGYDRDYKEAQAILTKNGINGAQLQDTLSKLRSDSLLNDKVRALTIGIARLTKKKEALEKMLPTTEIGNAQKRTKDAIQALTNDFIALVKAPSSVQS